MIDYKHTTHRNLSETIMMDEDGNIYDIMTSIGFALWIVDFRRWDYDR